MKPHVIVLATLVLMTVFTPTGISPSNPGEKPFATVCVTYVNAGVGCATGTLSHVMGVCGSTCEVTLRADLLVTPVACGWIGWKQESYFSANVATCAEDFSKPPRRADGVKPLALPPGAYQVQGEVCVTDPTITVTVPCDLIWHNYAVPGGDAGSNAVYALSLVPNGVPDPRELGRVVYEGALFIVYELI